MSVLSDARTLLNIPEDDTSLDEKLEVMVSHAESRLLSHLIPGTEEVPTALEYIVTELVVSRFNKVGNEGMSSFSQDGESIVYLDSDLSPWLDDIEAWNAAQEDSTTGRVRFL